MRLNDIQARFRDNMLDPDLLAQDEQFSAQFTKSEITLDNRFSVYRNNVVKSLTDVITATYPVIEKLVGEDFLRDTARVFVRQSPPQHGCLHDYGSAFADFLTQFEPAKNLPYLPDVARMEWAWNKAYYAVDDEPLDPESLTTIAPDKFDKLRFSFRDSVQLIESPYPLDDIRDFSLHDNPEGTLNVDKGGVFLMIFRPELDVQIHILEENEYRALKLLKKNDTIFGMSETILPLHPNFNLETFLQKHLMLGIFSGYDLDKKG